MNIYLIITYIYILFKDILNIRIQSQLLLICYPQETLLLLRI